MGVPINNIEAVIDGMRLPIFPVADSLGEAIQRIDLLLPEVPRSRIAPLIGMYHNTLLNQIKQELAK